MEINDKQQVMSIIIKTGDVKEKARNATQEARNNNEVAAKELLEQAEYELVKIHNIHTSLLGSDLYVEQANILVIHAEDHLTTATLMLDMAKEFVAVYQELNTLKEACDKV